MYLKLYYRSRITYSNFQRVIIHSCLYRYWQESYNFLFMTELIRIVIHTCTGLTLQWRHNGRDGVWNHQPHDCLLRRRSKKTSKLRVTGLCSGNSPVTSEFSAQMASNSENVSIWWRHHGNGLHHRYIGSILKLGWRCQYGIAPYHFLQLVSNSTISVSTFVIPNNCANTVLFILSIWHPVSTVPQ